MLDLLLVDISAACAVSFACRAWVSQLLWDRLFPKRFLKHDAIGRMPLYPQPRTTTLSDNTLL